MITSANLRAIAAARLQDARVLLAHHQFDGAVYICGYAVELCLKARICDTLHWKGYPEFTSEFKDLTSFKVQNLQVLLILSGRESAILQNHFGDWSIVKDWKPEMRYKLVDSITLADATAFVQATEILLQQI